MYHRVLVVALITFGILAPQPGGVQALFPCGSVTQKQSSDASIADATCI